MQETLETQVPSLGLEDLEEGMATHSSILAWRIPWTGEPDGFSTSWTMLLEDHGYKLLFIQNSHPNNNLFC